VENRLLFVQPVVPNDTLADLRDAIHSMASGYGCRAILFVGLFNSENSDSQPDSQVESLESDDSESPQIEAPKVAYERRMVGHRVLVMTCNYPTNDDLAAVRVLMADYVSGVGKSVVVVNDSHGEFTCLASHVCSGTVYSIMPDILDETREQIYARNIAGIDNVARIDESKAAKSDPSGADVVILVNPKAKDFEQHLRHLRMGGIAIFVSTDGTAPFIHATAQLLVKQSTNSVFSVVREEPRSQ
jgi:hypothetical protein